jgi:hypothetical protein
VRRVLIFDGEGEGTGRGVWHRMMMMSENRLLRREERVRCL